MHAPILVCLLKLTLSIQPQGVALCAPEPWGCMTAIPDRNTCELRAQLSDQGIGSPSQTWYYDRGLLRTNSSISSCVGGWTFEQDGCLGPKFPPGFSRPMLQVGASYPLAVQPCTELDHRLRFVFDEEENRVVSMARTSDGNTPFCVTKWNASSV